jgi:hypothetical protein
MPVRFDPNTCRMVDDGWRHSNPICDASPRVEEEHWIWKVIGISVLFVWAAIGLNWLDDHCSWDIGSKIRSYFVSDSSKKSTGEKACHNETLPADEIVPQTPKLTVVCCVCNTRFDATQFSHYAAFDCDCPGCGRILHVENNH